MSKLVRFTAGSVLAMLLCLGLVSPAQADVSVRDTTTSDLYVQAERPSLDQLTRQAGAFWNTSVPIDAKVAVSRGGAGARASIERLMAFNGSIYNFMSMRGEAIGPVFINANTMTVTIRGVMAGFPAQQARYHYYREDGLWKFDWKAYTQEQGFQGWDFGY